MTVRNGAFSLDEPMSDTKTTALAAQISESEVSAGGTNYSRPPACTVFASTKNPRRRTFLFLYRVSPPLNHLSCKRPRFFIFSLVGKSFKPVVLPRHSLCSIALSDSTRLHSVFQSIYHCHCCYFEANKLTLPPVLSNSNHGPPIPNIYCQS